MRFAWIAVGAGLLAAAACSPAAARPAAAGHDRPHAVTAAREGRDRMELDVVSGATAVAISSARLGGGLLRASTPADSGVVPDLVVGDKAQLFLDGTGLSGPAALRIVLNSQVTWRLVFTGGASDMSVDLGAGRFGGADFAAGSALITMRLPEPDGTVTVVLAGGASQVSLSIPAGVAAPPARRRRLQRHHRQPLLHRGRRRHDAHDAGLGQRPRPVRHRRPGRCLRDLRHQPVAARTVACPRPYRDISS
jgi:hypothetical protein